MTSTVYFNIFTGWRMESVTIKVFMIISERFSMNFAILLITFTKGGTYSHPSCYLVQWLERL